MDRARRQRSDFDRRAHRGRQPTAARTWVEEIRQRAARASSMPRAGRVVPEVARDDVREVFQRTYRIVYRVVDDGIVVLTVFEGHRLMGKLDPDQG
ncbi:MAG: type II toxin-antitoxin system RelE/ParE family toxin [Deltaproteobacteria bacterium]|nr:type II toxin-antitoxin system RelE/ParE family toxin [Deltaproteobacteria bacterium]